MWLSVRPNPGLSKTRLLEHFLNYNIILEAFELLSGFSCTSADNAPALSAYTPPMKTTYPKNRLTLSWHF